MFRFDEFHFESQIQCYEVFCIHVIGAQSFSALRKNGFAIAGAQPNEYQSRSIFFPLVLKTFWAPFKRFLSLWKKRDLKRKFQYRSVTK